MYSEKAIDQPAAERLLRSYINRNSHLLTFENIPPPSEHQFQEAIRRSKNSAPGPNGIPYAAYKVLPETSALVLHAHSQLFASDTSPPKLVEFNRQIVWFVPKGMYEHDDTMLIRTPDQLRTIFGSNVDSKF